MQQYSQALVIVEIKSDRFSKYYSFDFHLLNIKPSSIRSRAFFLKIIYNWWSFAMYKLKIKVEKQRKNTKSYECIKKDVLTWRYLRICKWKHKFIFWGPCLETSLGRCKLRSW